MRPLLRTGDLLFVRRVAATDARRGDIVVVRHESGDFLAHLSLNDGEPIRTGTFAGVVDSGSVELVGRVERVHRDGIEIPLPGWTRHGIWWLHRVRSQSSVRQFARRAETAVAWVARRRPVRWGRRKAASDLEIRRLTLGDVRELLRFAADFLPASGPFFEAQLRGRWGNHGAAVGAFESNGRLRGLVHVDELKQGGFNLEGWWASGLFVVPALRGVRVANRLLTAICTEAGAQGIEAIRAAVPTDDWPAQSAFARAGFLRLHGDLEDQVATEWARKGTTTSWAVFERRT
jgi:hypothetical protein